MRSNARTNRDDANFETVILRRFHLTPGQPEYVIIKRRVSMDNADQPSSRGEAVPGGDKSKYTDKQKRKAEHIEQGYEERGVSEPEAENRAWATVNKMDGGGKRSGSGRGKPVNRAPAQKGGKKGGTASAAHSQQSKSESAPKAAKPRSTLKTRLRPSATS